MEHFFEGRSLFRILYLTVLWTAIFAAGIDAVEIECIKADVCSCKTNTTEPQQEMSLWPIPSKNEIESATPGSVWLYDINLCHGIKKNVDADGGCPNSTVCQYDNKNKGMTFEIGHFGNVTFGKYDNETKSIILTYVGSRQGGTVRSIAVTVKCNEKGNITNAEYDDVKDPLIHDEPFTTTITTKAACLRPVVVPLPTKAHTHGNVGTSGGLKTVYIVLIVIAGLLIVLVLGSLAAYRFIVKRKQGLLNYEEDEPEDYGTVPRVHVQNALSTPVSGTV